MYATGRAIRRYRQIIISFIILALCLAAGLINAGCSDHDHEHPHGRDEATADADGQPLVHVYQLRGRIVSLPDPADPVSELRIHHEAIDDFKMADGSPAPMAAMTMPFIPGSPEAIKGLAVGDAVAFEFHMQWRPDRSMIADAIQKLPDGTGLAFEAKPDETQHAGH